MAGEKQVNPGGGLAGVADILKLLGGTQSTTNNTGDASGLYSVQNDLKNQDFSAMLQSIFQQAAGSLPSLQSRLSNAVGARTGNNGAVQAALQKTLQNTTLAAQQQLAQQQGQNLATRGNVAAQIANATNAQETTSGLNYGGAAKALGGLQLASQIGKSDIYKKGKDLFGGLLGNDSNATPATESASDLFSNFDVGAAPDITQNMDIPDLSGILDLGMPDLSGFGDAADLAGDAASGASDIDYGLEFADGGLVRRGDGASFNTKRALAAEGEADPDTQARYDAMKKANEKQKADKASKAKNDYDKTSNMVDQATGIRFADGGTVSINSGGGRRSSAPSYTPDAILASIAGNGRGSLSPAATPTPVDRKDSSQSHDTSSPAAGPGALSFGLKALAGILTGNPLGLISAALDSAVSTQTQSPTNAFSLASSLATANPIGILANLAKMTSGKDPATEGYNSLGNATGIDNANGFSGLNAAVSGEGAFGLNAPDASSGVGIGIDAALDGPSIGADTGGTDGFGEDGFGGGGFDDGGDGFGGTGGFNGSAGGGYGSDGGDGSGDGGDGDGGGGGGHGMAANGGEMKGPGTGTSDSINIRVSDGEYIIPADVVEQLGVGFFDHLRSQFHTPVTPNSPNWKKTPSQGK